MDKDIKDFYINSEKEETIYFDLNFKLILFFTIFLTGLVSIAGLLFIGFGINNHIWNDKGINYFLNQVLFFLSIILCLISLVTIAILKKPFSKILVRCFMVVGCLFIITSVIFPRINGYQTSGFDILTNGTYTLFDGSLLTIGLLGVLFSKILKYGFQYQMNSEMTI